MKINNKNGVLDFIAESREELPFAVDLAHKQAISFRSPTWCDKCKEYHTMGVWLTKHPAFQRQKK